MTAKSTSNPDLGINILDVKIPPQLRENVKTNVTWIDDAFGGVGLTPSQTVLFTGTPGAGKTTTLLQVADGWTKGGGICLYNTCEEAIVQVRKVVERLDLKHGFVPGQNQKVPDVLTHCEYLRTQNPKKKILLILDSLQVHDDGKYKDGGTNSMTPVRIADMINDYCKTHFACSIMIGQVTKSGKFAGKAALQHHVDTHAHLHIDQRPSSETLGKRIFKLEKNRFGSSGIAYVLDMNATKGLVVNDSFWVDDEESDA